MLGLLLVMLLVDMLNIHILPNSKQVSLNNRSNMSSRTDKPQPDENNGQGRTESLDTTGRQVFPDVDGCKGKTDVRENKCPPGETKFHIADTSKDGESGQSREPDGDEPDKEADGDRNRVPGFTDWEA